jgi:transcriptional regulator with XRE-family HTH domain
MNAKKSAIVVRIDKLLRERGENRKVLVGLGGIKSVQTITDWNERGTIPRADVALAIADYFGVSIRWLLTGEDENGISRDDRNALAKYQCLGEDNKRVIQATMDAMMSVPET